MAEMKNIFLVGPMGVGKTTIGKKLAAKLGRRFFDSDSEIVKRTGASISLIFDVEGEQGFRERESRVIDEIAGQDNIVLATGGGAVLLPENREKLSSNGTVIYLKASPELLIKRTAYDSSRPLLNSGDRPGKIRSLLTERDPVYTQLARVIINVDNMSTGQIVKKIMKELESK